jgi:hypothetical protein
MVRAPGLPVCFDLPRLTCIPCTAHNSCELFTSEKQDRPSRSVRNRRFFLSLPNTWGTSLLGGRGMKALARQARANQYPAAPLWVGDDPVGTSGENCAIQGRRDANGTNLDQPSPRQATPLNSAAPTSRLGPVSVASSSFLRRHPASSHPASSLSSDTALLPAPSLLSDVQKRHQRAHDGPWKGTLRLPGSPKFRP